MQFWVRKVRTILCGEARVHFTPRENLLVSKGHIGLQNFLREGGGGLSLLLPPLAKLENYMLSPFNNSTSEIFRQKSFHRKLCVFRRTFIPVDGLKLILFSQFLHAKQLSLGQILHLKREQNEERRRRVTLLWLFRRRNSVKRIYIPLNKTPGNFRRDQGESWDEHG